MADSNEPIEKLVINQVRFLREQDGIAERELKQRLSELFTESGSVHRAYLAVVSYGASSSAIALCLRSNAGPADTTVEAVATLFAEMFGPQEHLDIILLDQKQELELSSCCPPFFGRELTPR